MKYKTILIDDEPLALDRLERLLQPYRGLIEIVDRAMSGHEAVEKIEAWKPDLIFLDIQMPELTGFEVLKKLTHQPWIIFSTAFDEYALKAFATNSIDYLLKPVDPERLQKALEKLHQLESHLPAEDFVRIHRSTIINLNHLAEVVREFSGSFRARMKDKKKTELSVSRGAKAKLGLS